MKKIFYVGAVVLLSFLSLAQEIKTNTNSTMSTLTLNLIGKDSSCYQPCNGSFTVEINGGIAPYTYTITTIAPYGGTITSTSFTSSDTLIENFLCSGVFTLDVCDNSGTNCGSITDTIYSFTYPTIIGHTYTPAGAPFSPFVHSVTVSISGGSPPYYVEWFDGTMSSIKTHTVNTNFDTAYVYIGDYYVSVLDSNNLIKGCSGTAMYSYSFTICDNSGLLSPGNIDILPNDTLCSGTTFTVNYNSGPFCLFSVYYSDDNNCSINYGCTSSSTCIANQTTQFDGFWFYSNNCAPLTMPTATLVVQTCAGIDNLNSNDIFSIVPNPNNGEFELLTNRYINGEVQIIDLTGKVLISEKINEDKKLKVNLSDGVYYIRVYSVEGVQQQKLMIIR